MQFFKVSLIVFTSCFLFNVIGSISNDTSNVGENVVAGPVSEPADFKSTAESNSSQTSGTELDKTVAEQSSNKSTAIAPTTGQSQITDPDNSISSSTKNTEAIAAKHITSPSKDEASGTPTVPKPEESTSSTPLISSASPSTKDKASSTTLTPKPDQPNEKAHVNHTMARNEDQTMEKPEPSAESPNSGFTLIVQPLTMAACFLVAFTRMH